MSEPAASLFSHRIGVETLRPRPSEIVVVPTEAERAAIVAALDLASLERLEGRYRLSRESDRVTLEGRLVANLEQRCVVSLEPVPLKVNEPINLVFAPQAEDEAEDAEPKLAEIDLDYDAGDPPEPIVNGGIDLGAVTLEFLALALDPYPRKPGVEWTGPEDDPAENSPFAALARLKRGE